MGKIGSGHFSAMARLGLREVRASLYAGSNISQSPELGEFGTQTPGEISEARREGTRDLEDERPQQSTLERKLDQARSREDRSAERGKERDSLVMDR